MEIKQLFNINFDKSDSDTLRKAYQILYSIDEKMEQTNIECISEPDFCEEISDDDIAITTRVLGLLTDYDSWTTPGIDD